MKEETVFSVLQQLRKLNSSASFKWVPTHFEPFKNPSSQVPSTAFKKEHWNVNDEQASKDFWISMASISVGLMGNLPFPFYAPCPEMGWKNQGCRISTRFHVSKRIGCRRFRCPQAKTISNDGGKGVQAEQPKDNLLTIFCKVRERAPFCSQLTMWQCRGQEFFIFRLQMFQWNFPSLISLQAEGPLSDTSILAVTRALEVKHLSLSLSLSLWNLHLPWFPDHVSCMSFFWCSASAKR